MKEKNQEKRKREKVFNLVNVKIKILMIDIKHKEFLDSGVHLGHMSKKWNPNMAPYILMKKHGIHIIDLNKTIQKLHEAASVLKTIIRSGRKIMFVATKKQAKISIESEALRLNMPYVTERWLGGMLTNFSTIKKSLKKMISVDKMMKEVSYQNLAKREKLMINRKKYKLEKLLGGMNNLTRLPAALFLIDTNKEHIAIKEAQKMGIVVFALVDTNSNPNLVNYPIPGNDDSTKSISIIVKNIGKAIEEGLEERKKDKEKSQNK